MNTIRLYTRRPLAMAAALGLACALASAARAAEAPKSLEEAFFEAYRKPGWSSEEEACARLAQEGGAAIPIAGKMAFPDKIPNPEINGLHHGLLLLQHLYVDPDPAIRQAAKAELERIQQRVEQLRLEHHYPLGNGTDGALRRIDAILKLPATPAKQAAAPYPRGLPAGLGEAGIDMTAKYFGYVNNKLTHYHGTVTSRDGVVLIRLDTLGPHFGDSSTIDIVTSDLGEGGLFIKVGVTAETYPGNKTRLFAKATSLEELQKKHPAECQVYRQVMDALRRGYATGPGEKPAQPLWR